jgi:hypothetical protein
VPLPITVSNPPAPKLPPAASEPLVRAAVVMVTDPRLVPEHIGEQGGPLTTINVEAGLSEIVVRLAFAANVPLSMVKVVLVAVASSARVITRTVTANILGYVVTFLQHNTVLISLQRQQHYSSHTHSSCKTIREWRYFAEKRG